MKKTETALLLMIAAYTMAQDGTPIRIKATKEQQEQNEKTKAKPQKPERSAFRNGYWRLGFNTLGNAMDNGLSALGNVVAGNFGAKQGYVLETGHIYYFNRYTNFPIKFGLDWTVLSLTYNQLDWESFVLSKGGTSASIAGSNLAANASSKLGPVFSLNPFEKLIIDFRAQIAYTGYYFDQGYVIGSTRKNFSFASNLKTAIVPNFGLTIRRKAIGFALDYSPGNVNYGYTSSEGDGEAKLKVNNTQLKISFTL